MESVSSSLSFFSKFRVSGEVFIHCLEDDVHRNFVSHLSSALLQAGVKPVIVAVGPLWEKFMPSITSFQIGIVVISKAYNESSLCVEDLVRIIERYETHGLLFMLVFYDIDPSDVHHLKLQFKVYVPYQVYNLKAKVSDNVSDIISKKEDLIRNAMTAERIIKVNYCFQF